MRRFPALTALAFVSVAALGGCIIENDPPPNRTIVIDPNNGPAQPQLLEPSATPGYSTILTGATIQADPGQGAGVFVEYHGNGDWLVWTTCDVLQGSSACNFEVDLSPTNGGSIASASLLADTHGDDSVSFSPTRTIASFRTLGEIDGVNVHVDPPSSGLIITERIDGSADPKFLYWNGPDSTGGGVLHSGAPIDPMQLDPSTP